MELKYYFSLKETIMKLNILAFIISINICFSQDQDTICSLQIHNKIWKKKFEEVQTVKEKIELIKYKINHDTIYIALNKFESIYDEYKDSEGNTCGFKIPIFTASGKNKWEHIDLNEEYDSYLIKMLDENTIEKIIPYLEEGTTSALGERAEKTGFIFIFLKDKKLRKYIRRKNKAKIRKSQ